MFYFQPLGKWSKLTFIFFQMGLLQPPTSEVVCHCSWLPLPQTNSKKPQKMGCFEDDRFLLGRDGLFSGAFLLLVSGRVIWRNCQASILTPLTFKPSNLRIIDRKLIGAVRLENSPFGALDSLDADVGVEGWTFWGWSGGMGCLFLLLLVYFL